MPAALRLAPFPLPKVAGKHVRRCLTDPGRQRLGLLTEAGLTVLSYQRGLADPVLFLIPTPAGRTRREEMRMALGGQIINLQVQRPADEPALALHPRENLLAYVTDDEIRLITPGVAASGGRLVHTFPDAEAAAVKAALFSCSGQVLWIGRAYPFSYGRQGLSDPWNELLAFSTADYRLLGRVAVQGEQQGGHNLAAHPTLEVVGVEVSCGQDGSWITFASLAGEQVTRAPAQVNGDNEPFSFAGFAPDGESLVTVGEAAVEEFTWPACQPAARVESALDGEGEDDAAFFGWNGAYVGQHFFTLAEGEEADVLRVFDCPGLRPVSQVSIAASAEEPSGLVSGLGADLLITHSETGVRAWRVTTH